MEKSTINFIIGLIIILIVIFFVVVGIIGDINNLGIIKSNEKKYQECINACEEQKTCLKYGTKGTGKLSITTCIESSEGSCKNNCIKKYK